MTNSHSSRIQLLIATHGDLGYALLRTAQAITGPQPDVASLALAPGQAVDAFTAQAQALLSTYGATLILVDILGGTPWNVALELARRHPAVRVVSGVNLPMLLEVMLSRENRDIDQLAQLAQETGAHSARIATL